MAGSRVTIDINTKAVGNALNQAINTLADPELLLADIGEFLVNRIHDHFNNEQDPQGNKWADLSKSYLAIKEPNPDKILQRFGNLARQEFYQIQGNTLLVGTDRVYGATMQFGAAQGQFGRTKNNTPLPWGDIPARPFLGISDEDEQEILAIVQDHLLNFNN